MKAAVPPGGSAPQKYQSESQSENVPSKVAVFSLKPQLINCETLFPVNHIAPPSTAVLFETSDPARVRLNVPVPKIAPPPWKNSDGGPKKDLITPNPSTEFLKIHELVTNKPPTVRRISCRKKMKNCCSNRSRRKCSPLVPNHNQVVSSTGSDCCGMLSSASPSLQPSWGVA